MTVHHSLLATSANLPTGREAARLLLRSASDCDSMILKDAVNDVQIRMDLLHSCIITQSQQTEHVVSSEIPLAAIPSDGLLVFSNGWL